MKTVLKILKITGISLISIIALLFIAPYFFPETIGNTIKKLANENIKGELNFSKSRLSFFHHFPSLTLTLYDVQLNGSAPFAKDTLVGAKELGFGINLASLVKGDIKVNEIFLYKSTINILVDSAGNANYNVYQSTSSKRNNSTADTTASLQIERIVIEESSLVYNDASLPMYINAQQFEYEGKGDLSKAIFDLASHIEVGKIDFEYGKQKYFIAKTLAADLVTKINTNSLAFNFEKNDILINQLPLNFKGNFEFLKDGYAMNFVVNSTATELEKMVTALPPELNNWVQKTKVKGTADILIELAGTYNATTQTMPSFKIDFGIRSGFIQHENAPAPMRNIFLNFHAALPQLNTDSLQVNIDSIFFNINQGYVSSIVNLKGLKTPTVKASVKSNIDIELLDKAMGIEVADFKGMLQLNAQCSGTYATTVVQKNIREKDTVISKIPSFSINGNLQNGYFKLAQLPEALSNINATINVKNTNGLPAATDIDISNINVNMLSNYIKGNIAFSGSKNNAINTNLQVLFNLADIEKFYPLKVAQIKGIVNANIVSKGNYNVGAKQFPTTNANLQLKNGFVKTTHYPNPISNITVNSSITNNNGTLNGTIATITPVGFNFENEPFTITASLKNFSNLNYAIAAAGTLNIGNIYKVFAIDGLSVNGSVKTKINLQGTQADAAKGRYDKLKNSGFVQVQQIGVTHEYFPKPFMITKGLFTFNNDKLNFSNFAATYGKSNFTLQGNLSNVINYALQKNAVLKGNFTLGSSGIYVDELMVFNSKETSSNTNSSGVVMIPKNLDVQLSANASKVLYQGLQLNNVKGNVHIQNGGIAANDVGFSVIDANANMTGNYNTLSANKASFTYAIKSDNFDIAKAYKEIELFKQLASAAKYCKGVVGIDYALQGKLNGNMMPIYPSLTGGGTVTIHDVKIAGMKLFTAVSKATNRDSVNNPNLKKVTVKTTIKNNIITVERTKMRIMGFRPRIEGQVNFDGQYNLKMRLGLPPFGIFGIPMSITGSGSNPKVKLGRGKKEDALEEQEAPEEDDIHQ
jgi:AsmA protein